MRKKAMELFRKYRIGEILGIVSPLVMAILSILTNINVGSTYRLIVTAFFLIYFALRLSLLLWSLLSKDLERDKRRMALLTSLVVFFSGAFAVVSLVYLTTMSKEEPLIGAYLILAIEYAAYATIKLVLAIYHSYQNRKTNDLYFRTLTFSNWVLVMYTLTLMTHYLMLAKGNVIPLPIYVMCGMTGLVAIYVAIMMFLDYLKARKKAKQEQNQGEA